MGGRGALSPFGRVRQRAPAGDDALLPYTVLSSDDLQGGWVYPFLERLRRPWRLVTRAAGTAADPIAAAHRLGQERPTLRWVNGDQVNDLYVAGLDTAGFLTATGLELDLHKGGFVLSKRISRIMRPYRASGFWPAAAVRTGYLTQTAAEAKLWDGAGLVSRAFLERLDRTRGTQTAEEARVEFTVGDRGGRTRGTPSSPTTCATRPGSRSISCCRGTRSGKCG